MAASRSTRLLLWITAVGVLILVALVVAGALVFQSGPGLLDSGEPRFLTAKLGGELHDAPGGSGIILDPTDMPPLVTETAQALREAAQDESVSGIYVEIRPIETGGWAAIEELRSALWTFRDAGKPCVVWSEQLTTKEYYLATACKEIHLAPAGVALVNGFSTTTSYYAGTFDKLGIHANFEHVGDFKSAVEPFERTEPSEAASSAMSALLDSLYTQFVAGIAEGRGIDVEAAQVLVDLAPMSPADALEAGLVDKVSFRDEVFTSDLKDDGWKLKDYLNDRRSEWTSGSDTIAVVYAEGTIVSGETGDQLFGGDNMIGDRTLVDQLEKLREDEDVKAIVLRINSPGGSGGASDAIWREIQKVRETKPVVASMADYAASGGYYIAMGTNRIVAQPNTVTGSIGVFGGKMNLGGLYEKVGITTHTYERGQSATIFSSIEDFDETDRAKFRRYLETFYETFLTRAAEGRPLTRDQLHEVAQGRVWTGEQALERKLVDELGGLDTAITRAAELASITEYAIERVPERRGFMDQLLHDLENPPESNALLFDPELTAALASLFVLERVLEDGQVAALLPIRLSID